MKAILILENSNGTLPPPYAYFYKISFYETGYAQLEFYSVHNEDRKNIHSDSRIFDLEQMYKELSKLREHSSISESAMVGGEIKKIIFERGGNKGTITIVPNDVENTATFNKFLKIYDQNFEKKKNDIVNKLYNNN